VLTTSHLKREHAVKVDGIKLLVLFQKEKLKGVVRTRINNVIKKVEELKRQVESGEEDLQEQFAEVS
jgi:hypothetical protein